MENELEEQQWEATPTTNVQTRAGVAFWCQEKYCKWTAGAREDLVAEAAVVHGGQAVVDGRGSVLVEGLAGRLRLQVTVPQGLHHGLRHLLLDLHPARTHSSAFGLVWLETAQ